MRRQPRYYTNEDVDDYYDEENDDDYISSDYSSDEDESEEDSVLTMINRIEQTEVSKFYEYLKQYTNEDFSLDRYKDSSEYLVLRITNLIKKTSKIFKAIENYAPGTYYEMMEDETDGSQVFVVYIKYPEPPPMKSRYYKPSSKKSWDWYNFSILTLLCIDGLLAYKTTSYVQWSRLISLVF